MALIKCIECGKEISDKATSCPHCGCPINPEEIDKTEEVKEIRNYETTINDQPQTVIVKEKRGCLISCLITLQCCCLRIQL